MAPGYSWYIFAHVVDAIEPAKEAERKEKEREISE